MNSLFLLFTLALAEQTHRKPHCTLTDRSMLPLAAVDPNNNQVMSYFGFGDFTANDGTVTYSCKKGLTINSNPFELWKGPNIAPELDHTKLVMITNETHDIPTNGKLVISGRVNAKVFNNKVCESPYPGCVVQDEDLRFGCAGFTAIDLANSLTGGFFITNDRIYAYYERLPFARPALGNYAAFIYVVPVARRHRDDFHELALTFDGAAKTISWSIEGVNKLTMTHIGARPLNREFLLADLGGEDVDFFPSAVGLLLGTFTLLDFYPACKDVGKCQYPCARIALTNAANEQAYPRYNPLLGTPYPCQYFDQVGTSEDQHIWGQGVTETIEWVKFKTYTC